MERVEEVVLDELATIFQGQKLRIFQSIGDQLIEVAYRTHLLPGLAFMAKFPTDEF